MNTPYNQIAGRNLERLAALSDGVFAFAMTLLVLDLHAPLHDAIHGEKDLQTALLGLLPHFVPYLMSFITLGIFWNGQQTQLNHFEQADRHLAWIHLAFLFFITLLPFSTMLLAEFIDTKTALVFYWLNILLLGLTLYASFSYAAHANLLKDDLPNNITKLLKGRIIIAQSLYAIGALLCMISNTLSIGVIFLVQLNYAIAPRIPFFRPRSKDGA